MNEVKNNEIQVLRKTKVETTFEYVPILGEVLGFWRKAHTQKFGEDIELHLRCSLNEYDRVYINGEQIEIPKI